MRCRSLWLLSLALVWPTFASAQIGALSAGRVSANVDAAAVDLNVSLAVVDEEGTLVLTHLGNDVQIQVPSAAVGTFRFQLDADGGLVGPILSLRARNRMITPVSGEITITTLTPDSASGTFSFEGRDLGDDAAVRVTDGRFRVRVTPRR